MNHWSCHTMCSARLVNRLNVRTMVVIVAPRDLYRCWPAVCLVTWLCCSSFAVAVAVFLVGSCSGVGRWRWTAMCVWDEFLCEVSGTRPGTDQDGVPERNWENADKCVKNRPPRRGEWPPNPPTEESGHKFGISLNNNHGTVAVGRHSFNIWLEFISSHLSFSVNQ